jgi:hypothetical protein
MRNLSVLVMIVAAMLLAAGCPKGEKPAPADGSATNSMAPSGSNTAASSSESTGSETAAQPPAGSEGASATSNNGAAGSAPAGESAAAADPSLLAGEWFAMFGRQDEGIVEDAWKTNHRIKFDKEGNVVFTLSINGKPQDVQGKYAAASGVVKLTLSAVKSVKSGLSHIAPLGIGRNEEVGLLKQAGRNEEIGLDKKSDVPDAAGNITRDVKYAVYGGFLMLSDSYDHLLIYGKFPGNQAPPAPDLAGAWTASIGANTGIATTNAWDGKQLTFDLGPQGKFTGTLVHGFVVGSIQRTPGLSLAALFPQGSDQLKGVYMPDPYLEFKTDLELVRAK